MQRSTTILTIRHIWRDWGIARMKIGWNTVSFGVTVPLSRSVSFNAELSPVLKGIRFAGNDWVAKIPLIVVVGISTSL
ncbi:MAG: hypothetical protein WEB33_04660 [Bacteroidota bacterium]